MSPTLARRFPVGPGDGTPTRWYLHCPYCLKSLPDHLLSAVVARYRKVRAAPRPILRRVRAELTIEIARSPEDVFAYLTDVSNLPAWQAGVKSATRGDRRIEESRSLLGRELHTTLEVVEEDEPRLFTVRALDSPVPFTVRHELEPADGGTRLAVTAEGDVPGFAAGLVARRAERQFRKDFERLKKILES
jgi:carbon monoxide dehydrogenase subunit G